MSEEETVEYWEQKLAEEDQEFTDTLQNLADLQRGVRLELNDLRDTEDGWNRALNAVESERQLLQDVVGKLQDKIKARAAAEGTPVTPTTPPLPKKGLLDDSLRKFSVADATPSIINTKKVLSVLRPKKGGVTSSAETTDGSTASQPTAAQLAATQQHINKLRRIKEIAIILNSEEQQGVMQRKAKLAKKAAKADKAAKKSKKSKSETPTATHVDPTDDAAPEKKTLDVDERRNPLLSFASSTGCSMKPHDNPSGKARNPTGSSIVLAAASIVLQGEEDIHTLFGTEDEADGLREKASAAIKDEVEQFAANESLGNDTRQLIKHTADAIEVTYSNVSCDSRRVLDVEVVLSSGDQLLNDIAKCNEFSILSVVNAAFSRAMTLIKPHVNIGESASQCLVGDDCLDVVHQLQAALEANDLSVHDGFLLAYALAQKEAKVSANIALEASTATLPPSFFEKPSELLWNTCAIPWLEFLADSSSRTKIDSASIKVENVPNELLQSVNKIANAEKRKLPKGMEAGPLAVSAKTKVSLALGVYDSLYIDLLRPYDGPENEKDFPVDPFVIHQNKEVVERARFILENFTGDAVATNVEAAVESTLVRKVSNNSLMQSIDPAADGSSSPLVSTLSADASKLVHESKDKVNKKAMLEFSKRISDISCSIAIPSPFVVTGSDAPFPSVVYVRISSVVGGMNEWLNEELLQEQ